MLEQKENSRQEKSDLWVTFEPAISAGGLGMAQVDNRVPLSVDSE